jgi:hypothetical protein
MNSDGTGKAPASGGPHYSVHGGHTWTVRWAEVPGETYPNGQARREASAVRDDGTVVALTNQPDLQVNERGSGSNPWTPDGLRLAWTARRWANGAVSEGGLYVAELTFDADGGITGLAAQPAAPAFARPLVIDSNGWAVTKGLAPDIRSFSWAPDGTQFVYGGLTSIDSVGNQRVAVADLAGADRFLVAGGLLVQWSPDGGRILFFERRSSAYHTVAPDGSGDKQVIGGSSRTSLGGAYWSPTGSHIAYFQSSNTTHKSSVYRVAATGGSATNLTSDLDDAFTQGWTQ